MKAGFETVIFGRIVDDWPEKFRMIREAGFRGIEIAQSPEMLRLSGVSDYQTLRNMLQDADLHLIGLAGGSLEMRLRWIGETQRPDYLYVSDWQASTYEHALTDGAVLAIHPHLYMPIDTMSHALSILSQYSEAEWPNLKLLPDTAHLFMTGSDPVQVLNSYAPRLAAIHLKDWVPQFGRYSHRYARGFVEPGQGILELEKICNVLTGINPLPQWTVIEVENSRTTVAETLRNCANWLEQHLPGTTAPLIYKSKIKSVSWRPSVIERERQLEFRTRLTEASQRSRDSFYMEAAAAFAELIPSQLVQVWVCTPGQDRLNLKGYHASTESKIDFSLTTLEFRDGNAEAALHSQVVAGQVCMAFDLNLPENREALSDRQMLNSGIAVGANWLLSIPVSNTWNAHHLRFVVNVFPDLSSEEVQRWLEIESRDAFLAELNLLAQALSFSADSMLDARCIDAMGAIHRKAPLDLDPHSYYRFLVFEVSRILKAEGVTLFIPNEPYRRLEWVATHAEQSELKWSAGLGSGDLFYHLDDPNDLGRMPVQAYGNQEMYYLDQRFKTNASKSWEIVTTPDAYYCMYFPIVSPRLGKTIGVLRCRNRIETLNNSPGSPFPPCGSFTDDEAAILDTLTQAAAPRMELLAEQRERIHALSKLTHEFSAPIATIQASVDMIQSVFRKRKTRPVDFFGRDYVDDIANWTQILFRLLQNAEAASMSFEDQNLMELCETDIIKEVVSPVVNQMAYRFRLKGFSGHPIKNNIHDLPNMWVDKNWMQVVFFNLLTNAWKYGGDPKHLQITLDSFLMDKNIVIRCSNNGPGVAPQYAEAIFKPGFRDPEARHRDVSGQGLGLATVMSIAKAHQGSVRLAQGRDPTIFELQLPSTLLNPPAQHLRKLRTLRS